MDTPALFLFGTTVANVILGLLVYLRNPKKRQYVYYFCFTLAIGLWVFTNGLFRLAPQSWLLGIALWSYVGSIFTAVFFVLFNREYTHLRYIVPDWVIVVGGTAFSLAALKPGVLATAVTPAHAIVTSTGINVLAVVLGGLFVWGLALMIWHQHRTTGHVRNQTQIMLTGMAVSIIFGVVFNLLLPLTGNYQYVYLGPAFTLVYLGVIAYSIIRHRLFSLRLALARSLVYALLIGTLGGAYTLVVFSISTYLFPAVDMPYRAQQNWVDAAVALILAFTFQPLRQLFGRITNRLFYRYHYDSQVVLNNFTKVLVSELDLERLLRHSLTNLCENLHIEFGQVIVYNHDRVYRIEHYGPLPRRLMIAPELARLNKPMLIADELSEGERKSLLEGHGVRVSLMLRTRDEFVGYLLLGDKLSGDIYSSQDIDVLEIVGKELAVAILNAKAYAEIQELNLGLQARIERATKRLRVANRHLKELDRAKDEFISMASHQLRTPLTTIKGYLSMMLEGDAGKLTHAQKDFVSYAFGSSERMVNLISDLLNVSRLQAGRFLIQTKPTDLVRMIRDEVRQLEEHAKSKGISLQFDLPTAPIPLVEIDENKTRQVIMNFIDNAIYYTQQGGVTVVLQQAGSRIRFEVRDTGIGVPHEARKKLFSKFFRAANAQTVRPDGTGLGLYLAKRVVEDQGGTIIFESVVGEGSTFGFELPYNPVGSNDPHAPNPTKPKRDHDSHSRTK